MTEFLAEIRIGEMGNRLDVYGYTSDAQTLRDLGIDFEIGIRPPQFYKEEAKLREHYGLLAYQDQKKKWHHATKRNISFPLWAQIRRVEKMMRDA